MSTTDPLTLYQAALSTDSAMSGYYNDNIRVDAPDGPILVRIPVTRADQMELSPGGSIRVGQLVEQLGEHIYGGAVAAPHRAGAVGWLARQDQPVVIGSGTDGTVRCSLSMATASVQTRPMRTARIVDGCPWSS